MKNQILFLSAALILSACAKSGSSDQASPTTALCGPKPVSSSWRNDSGSVLDLTAFRFDQAVSEDILDHGFTCRLSVTLTGSECSGVLNITSGVVISGDGFTTLCQDWVGRYDFYRLTNGMAFGREGGVPLAFH
jgi:hypothetical protein